MITSSCFQFCICILLKQEHYIYVESQNFIHRYSVNLIYPQVRLSLEKKNRTLLKAEGLQELLKPACNRINESVCYFQLCGVTFSR